MACTNRFGKTLRFYRGARTQVEIATRAGISRNYLSALETGAHGQRIPRHTVTQLATALDIEPAILLQLAGHPVGPFNVPEPRPDFVSFVLSEPTLTDDSARSAVLAVYSVVAEAKSAGKHSALKKLLDLAQSTTEYLASDLQLKDGSASSAE